MAYLSILFGVDIKLAGSLSLAVSLPTMLIGFTRYSRDRSFVILRKNRRFVLVMASGSIVGSVIGGPTSRHGAVADLTAVACLNPGVRLLRPRNTVTLVSAAPTERFRLRSVMAG